MIYVFLVAAIGAEVCGTLALKASIGFTRLGPSALVCLCYGMAFYFLSITLRTIPVGVAYAIWSGMGTVLISALGWFVFRQPLDGPTLLGMALIVAGVLTIHLFSGAVVP